MDTKKINNVISKFVFILIFLVLFAYALTLVYAIFWAFISSMKDTMDYTFNLFGFPKKWMTSNYILAYKNLIVRIKTPTGIHVAYMPELFFNSVIYTAGCALVATITPCVTAYLVARYRFRFNKVINTIVVVTLVMPVIGNLPSMYVILRTLHFYDNFLGLFYMKATFLGVNYLIFFAAFKGISSDYADSAFLDGAGHFKVMVKIMIPMVLSVFSVVLLLQIIGFWNDWETLYLFAPSKPSIAFGLYLFQFSTDTLISNEQTRLAAAVLVSLPAILTFIIFRNKIMGSLDVGGLKG